MYDDLETTLPGLKQLYRARAPHQKLPKHVKGKKIPLTGHAVRSKGPYRNPRSQPRAFYLGWHSHVGQTSHQPHVA